MNEHIKIKPVIDAAALEGMVLPEELFIEPAKGGIIDSVKRENEEYVTVQGRIFTFREESPNIMWKLLLPGAWNRRTVQYGGGANNGVIPDLEKAPGFNSFVPVKEGYAAYGDDSGHQSEPMSSEFAANDEALANYTRLHLIKTYRAVQYIIEKYYGVKPEFNYFAGFSTGGREALECATTYGKYYDGVFAGEACSNYVLCRIWGALLSQAVYESYDPVNYPKSDGFIDEETVKAIQQDAIKRYDALDGIEDGIVSNIFAARAGREEFLKEIQEKYHLTQAQLKTIEVYESGYKLDYRMASNGMNEYHGYAVLEGGLMDLGPDPVPREPLDTRYNVHHGDRSDGVFKYFITKDPNWKLIDHDYRNPTPELYKMLMDASEEYDANAPDFDEFIAHGGKMILFAGWHDMSQGPWQQIQQYRGYREKYGEDKLKEFCKFYIMPSVTHGGGMDMPYLDWIDEWCSIGTYPTEPVYGNMHLTGGQMPMAEFPGWVKYIGGDPMKGESYEVSYDIPDGFWGKFD